MANHKIFALSKKILATILCFSFSVCFLSGCFLFDRAGTGDKNDSISNNKQNINNTPVEYVPESEFNASLDGYVNDYIPESFLDENRVKAYYKNEKYTGDIYSEEPSVIYEENQPTERIFILKSEAEFNQIFTGYEKQIDFEKQMAILIIFPSVDLSHKKYILNEIKEEDKNRIFEKFSRIDNPLTREVQGSGLGLFITKTLVETMKGTINVESSNGITVFEVLMPICDIENQARAKCSQKL